MEFLKNLNGHCVTESLLSVVGVAVRFTIIVKLQALGLIQLGYMVYYNINFLIYIIYSPYIVLLEHLFLHSFNF
jgi:hypothetical protein